MITEIGPVELDVPRDTDGTFEPKTVRKHQRRLQGVDAMVLSLCAKGLTTGEIAAHLVEVYGRRRHPWQDADRPGREPNRGAPVREQSRVA